jgi:hypothetical protein
MLDLAGGPVLADQPQRGFQGQPGREQPAHHNVVQPLGDPVLILSQAQQRLRRVACRAGRPAGRP